MTTPSAVVAGAVRAYFAPVDRATGAPAAFNLARDGAFPLDAPPAPWLDLGWIDNFSRTAATAVEPVRCGPKAAPAVQLRRQLEARVEFAFGAWGRFPMAIAGGSELMNVFAAGENGAPLPAAVLLAGSTATELKVGAESVGAFAPGGQVAVDADYNGETGYVGAFIAGAYVRDPAALDGDFLRRVTFNLGRIREITADALLLEAPLPAGVPLAAMRVQPVCGFCDREGGAFFQEFSALFVLPEEGGGRLVLHYPRLQAAAPASEHSVELAAPLRATLLRASLRALPVTDPADGETVLCYRAWFPAA